MRISDWSSDVCSSDLVAGQAPAEGKRKAQEEDDRYYIGGAKPATWPIRRHTMGIVGHRPHLRHGSLLPPLLHTERLTHLMRETAEARAISNAIPVAVTRPPPVPVSVPTSIALPTVPP